MSIADSIRELETKLETTQHDLWSCNQVAKVRAEATEKLQKKCDRLQEDLDATSAQRDEIKKLKKAAQSRRRERAGQEAEGHDTKAGEEAW